MLKVSSAFFKNKGFGLEFGTCVNLIAFYGRKAAEHQLHRHISNKFRSFKTKNHAGKIIIIAADPSCIQQLPV